MKDEKHILKTINQEVDINVSKVTCVNLKSTDKQFIHYDMLKDGTWRLVYTKGSLKEFVE